MIIAVTLRFTEGLHESSVQFKIGFGHLCCPQSSHFLQSCPGHLKRSFLQPFILSSGHFQSNKFPVHFHDFCLSLQCHRWNKAPRPCLHLRVPLKGHRQCIWGQGAHGHALVFDPLTSAPVLGCKSYLTFRKRERGRGGKHKDEGKDKGEKRL